MAEPLDLDLLDEDDPFEIDEQAAHLFKHAALGIDDVRDVWRSDPLFYPAKPPAHWLMVADVSGRVLVVPIAPPSLETRAGAARSAATTLRPIWPSGTGRTDDQTEDDPAGRA